MSSNQVYYSCSKGKNKTKRKEENKMKWFIDFSGYCEIEADSIEEASNKFWAGLQPPSEEAFNNFCKIDGIEENTK